MTFYECSFYIDVFLARGYDFFPRIDDREKDKWWAEGLRRAYDGIIDMRGPKDTLRSWKRSSTHLIYLLALQHTHTHTYTHTHTHTHTHIYIWLKDIVERTPGKPNSSSTDILPFSLQCMCIQCFHLNPTQAIDQTAFYPPWSFTFLSKSTFILQAITQSYPIETCDASISGIWRNSK